MTTSHRWLAPSAGLTVATGAVVLSRIPDRTILLAAMSIYPAWIVAAAVISSICMFVHLVRLGVARPTLELRRMIVTDRAKAAWATLVVLLAGLNMITFMWMKTLLNFLVPFRAGPWLAQIDHMLFLGHDPWTLLTWLNFPAAGLIYHPVWFVMLILALLIVAWAPASPEKSAMLLSYFVLWSVAGPVIHVLMPAAGPLFYERLGYGSRFAGLHQLPETQEVANYLWAIYSSRRFGAGSGISAMPSMHVAMVTWATLAIAAFAPRLKIPAVGFAALIYLMSIALGWHYAVDGLVGSASAAGCYLALRTWYRRGVPAADCATVRQASLGDAIRSGNSGLYPLFMPEAERSQAAEARDAAQPTERSEPGA